VRLDLAIGACGEKQTARNGHKIQRQTASMTQSPWSPRQCAQILKVQCVLSHQTPSHHERGLASDGLSTQKTARAASLHEALALAAPYEQHPSLMCMAPPSPGSPPRSLPPSEPPEAVLWPPAAGAPSAAGAPTGNSLHASRDQVSAVLESMCSSLRALRSGWLGSACGCRCCSTTGHTRCQDDNRAGCFLDSLKSRCLAHEPCAPEKSKLTAECALQRGGQRQ